MSAIIGAVAALGRGRRRPSLAFVAIAAAGHVAGRRWSRSAPSPMPASLRWVLALPRPTGALLRAVEPRPRERILELGPGLGQQAVQIGQRLGPDGRLDVLDVQQEMLDATSARAKRHGLGNVAPSLADASGRLPYDDEVFDAAYLSSVLGEIPDREGALRELHRVLRSGGRLVVAEVALDPEFIRPRQLRELGEHAGFRFERRLGAPFAYHARLVKL
jgi:SAM-dependent methyltransferase